MLTDSQRSIAPIVLYPAVNNPARMPQTLGEGGCSLVELGLRPSLPRQLAEDRIDHTGSMAMTRRPNQLHGLAERRMGRDAVEMLQLERSHPKRSSNRAGKREVRPLEQRLHNSIKGDLPTKHAKHQGGSKIAVGLREPRHAWAMEQVVGVSGGGSDSIKDGEGGRSGRGNGGVAGCSLLHSPRFGCQVLHRAPAMWF